MFGIWREPHGPPGLLPLNMGCFGIQGSKSLREVLHAVALSVICAIKSLGEEMTYSLYFHQG
mgnify:CR=1 FL=1